MDFPREFGPYRLIKQIAMGGMAEIVLARTEGFGGFEKFLALKMIHPKLAEDQHFINMLIEEAKICVELSHVNICQVFDLGRIGETHYLAMEFVEGVDVFKMMRRATEVGYEIPIETCVHIGQEICSGLDYAHNKCDSEGRPLGIIHRDVSPQNILISFSGEVKIVDFGIAKAGLRAKQTEVGVIKGKYYYMSPEQAWADPVDHRSDLFSAAIIVYEMLTGQMLYLEENLEVLLDRVRKAEIEPPSSMRPEVPRELDDILMKALSKYPDNRYQSAAELGHELGNLLYHLRPDYTTSHLAGMMSWLFDGDDVREREEVETSPKQSPSLLLTREDFVNDAVSDAGSLLFELSELEDLADATTGSSTFDDFEPTAQVDLSDVEDEKTSRVDFPDDFDATVPVSVPFDLQRFDSSDTQSGVRDWDESVGDETKIDAPARISRIIQINSDHQTQPSAQPSRDAGVSTRVISSSELSNEPTPGPGQSPSYQPPPPPGFAPGRLKRAPSSYSPPRPPGMSEYRAPAPPDDLDDEDNTRRSSASSVPEPSVKRPSQAPFDAPRLPSPFPEAPSSRPEPVRAPTDVTRPVDAPRHAQRPSAHDIISSVPPDDRTSQELSLPIPSPVDVTDLVPNPPHDVTARASTGQPEQSGETSLTAYVPTAGPTEFSFEKDDDPTGLINNPTPYGSVQRSEPSVPRLHPQEDDSQPTRLLPQRDGTAEIIAPRPMGDGGQASREAPQQPQPQPQPRPQPQPQPHLPPQPQQMQPPLAGVGRGPSQPPPWLIGGDQPFGGRSVEPSSNLSTDPDMLDDDVLDAPPDLTGGSAYPSGPPGAGYGYQENADFDDDFVVRRTNWGPILKVGIPLVLITGLAVAAYFLVPMMTATTPSARLDVRSHPAGARVYLDGQPISSLTPTAVENLEMGSVHQVELRLDGFVPWSQSVEIRHTEVRQIAILRPILGTLRVTSEPIGASVSVEGVYQGVTPCEVTDLDINREVRVQVRYRQQSETRNLSWQGETEVVMNFEFEEEQRGRSRYR